MASLSTAANSSPLGLAADYSSIDEPTGNPIVVGRGLCGLHARVYDNQVYIYATHDAVPSSDRFVMNDWWVWRSRNRLGRYDD